MVTSLKRQHALLLGNYFSNFLIIGGASSKFNRVVPFTFQEEKEMALKMKILLGNGGRLVISISNMGLAERNGSKRIVGVKNEN